MNDNSTVTAIGCYKVLVGKQLHFVDKSRRCSCGRKCPAIKAVADYLRQGGQRAPDCNPGAMEPHNIEAEEAVLGSVLIDPVQLFPVRLVLSANDFYLVKSGWIWEALLALYEHRQPIDFLTVCEELSRRGQLEEIGGQAYVSHLINVVPTAIHAVGYAQIVKDGSVRRQLLAAASDVARLAYEGGADADSLVEAAVERVQRVHPTSYLSAAPEQVWYTTTTVNCETNR